MANLRDASLEAGYSSDARDLLSSFYEPVLQAANSYDRAVGYFRSSLFAVAGLAFADFAARDGRMRLVCSPELTLEDVRAIKRGLTLRKQLSWRIGEVFDDVLTSPANVPVVRFLSTLVAEGVLEVRLAFKRNELGLYHNKVGIVEDEEGNRVSFLGTANETMSAWCSDRNHEGLEVFRDWIEGDRSRVVRHQDYFSRLWSRSLNDLEVLDFREIASDRIEEYVVDEGIEEAARLVREEFDESYGEDRQDGLAYSSSFSLMEHQRKTVESWWANGQRGIVKHATGAGKTITALEIIRQWLRERGPAVVSVPTRVLLSQWKDEATGYLGSGVSILQVGGGEPARRWTGEARSFTSPEEFGERLIIGTLASLRSERARSRITDGEHLLLVADEVHTVGSPEGQKLLSVQAGGRLGLSATPRRYGDPDGTRAILEYFGGIVDPVIDLSDAISAGRLVPYDYHPHRIRLTRDEQNEWDTYTNRIKEEYAQLPEDKDGRKEQSERLKHLLISRARILKQAEAKIGLAAEVLSERYDEGERWLVYCDNTDQLDQVADALRTAGLPVMVYHSAMDGSRNDTMQYFRGDAEFSLFLIPGSDRYFSQGRRMRSSVPVSPGGFGGRPFSSR